jgi:hypothetical protein
MAVQKPALNIPPTTSQELKLTINAIAIIHTDVICFIAHLFTTNAKALPEASKAVNKHSI